MIQVGGVPEHFNLPWHIAMEEGFFAEQGIDLRWKDYKGGTGAMCQDLESGSLDIALLLTEGAIAAIEKGNPSYIHSVYVGSPLIWGIHTGTNSKVESPANEGEVTYAVSRMGSGSHLMALVDRIQRKLPLEEAKWNIIQNLDGAVDSLTKLSSDLFLWEKFTTAPFVYSGQLRRVGEVPTPWPCFVMTVRKEAQVSEATLDKINLALLRAVAFIQQSVSPIKLIASRYQLKEEDVVLWYETIQWTPGARLEEAIVSNVKRYLKEAKIL
ncbi:MAG: hypothetical protein U0U66_13495 [Cytophagaceae bacterium]